MGEGVVNIRPVWGKEGNLGDGSLAEATRGDWIWETGRVLTSYSVKPLCPPIPQSGAVPSPTCSLS